MSANDDFFKGKRPWSLIKDNVLGAYMPAYLAKVNTLHRPIMLVDGYAGPGVFEDGTSGSPMIICHCAESRAKGNYSALFVNKNREHHDRLSSVLAHAGLSEVAHAIRGDAREIVSALPGDLGDQTLFLYLDPFGPTGCEFSVLEPFLRRNHVDASTEIVLTMSMPAMHRFATRKKIREGQRIDHALERLHQNLTKILGGNYWQDILWRESGTSEEREWDLIEAYCSRIRRYLPVAKYCPVREAQTSRIKYFIVFASRHQDSLLLMNDAMAKAYHAHIHQQIHQGGLWADQDWRKMRGIDKFEDDLDTAILSVVASHTGLTRANLWVHIVNQHFMQYTKAEFIQAVKRMINEGKLNCPPDPKTKRLNDSCIISLGTR